MAKAHFNKQTEVNTKVAFLRMKSQAMAHTLGLMVESTLERGNEAKCMGKAF